LIDTTYGRVLNLKLTIIGLLLAPGAVNMLFLSPLLQRAIEKATRWLQNSVRTELALGLFVLFSIGMLTTVAPTFNALTVQRSLGLEQTIKQNHVNKMVCIAPAHIGDNEFGVDVSDCQQGQAVVRCRREPEPDRVEAADRFARSQRNGLNDEEDKAPYHPSSCLPARLGCDAWSASSPRTQPQESR
jgi:hypothetical protein